MFLFFLHALVDELHLLVEIMCDLAILVLHPALPARHFRRLRRHLALQAVDGGLPLAAGLARHRPFRAGGEQEDDRRGGDGVPGERAQAARLSQVWEREHRAF